MDSLWDGRFTPADAQIIKHKAKKLVGHYGYRFGDVEDIRQDLAAHVLQRMDRYQPGRGPRAAFVSTVAKHKLLNLIEQRRALKRGGGRNVPLDAVGEGVLLDSRTAIDAVDLAIDVRTVLEGLPDELQQMAILRQCHTERQLELLLGLTRGQVRARIRQLEAVFRRAGLAPEFKKPQPFLPEVR